jgi:hypothetical protein
MHTMNWEDPDTAVKWYVHHNGDFSGDVFFETDSGLHQRVEEMGRVEIPFDLLKELVGRYIQGRVISNIEDMDGADTIDYVSSMR